MTVQAITFADSNSAGKNKKYNAMTKGVNQPSFSGLDAIPVAVANALDNGGLITAFIAQDFFGMAGPRVMEGINRRPVNPETGKKEGPYNWAFARREGIREILSGPSAFIIPAFILHFVKKYSGKANNVPVNMIQGLGTNFIDYASKNPATLDDVATTRTGYYKDVFKNVFKTTFGETLGLDEIESLSKEFAERTIQIEQAKDKKKSFFKKIANIKVDGSPEDLTEDLLKDFMDLKKRNLNPLENEMVAELTINPDKYGKASSEILPADKTAVSFKKLLKTMNDFTDDVISSTSGAIKKYSKEKFEPERFLKDFVSRRTGSRIVTNLGMWSAVVGFYMLIPKLYSLGLKGKNPAFIHEQKAAEAAKVANNQNNVKLADSAKTEPASADKQDSVAFTGKEKFFTSTAEKVLKSPKAKSFIDKFEFDDASMSVTAMLALLFGFCLPPRLLNAPDKYDLKETILRDITSFLSILFAAKALARGISDVFSKQSGLALSSKPQGYNENAWKIFKNYFAPSGGVEIFSNNQLDAKYVNIDHFKGGINGFFEFVKGNGGNLKKMLKLDKNVEENVKIILGKSLKDVKDDSEIIEAFKNINGKEKETAIENIKRVFSSSSNKFVKRAKLYNSMFTFLSTIVLVPSFMVWLARTCDKVTREARAKDLAAAKTESASNDKFVKQVAANQSFSPNKVTMQGFLNS